MWIRKQTLQNACPTLLPLSPMCSLSCLCVSQSPPGLTLQREHTEYMSFLHQPACMLPALPRCLLPDLPPLSTCRRGTSTFLSGRFRHERSHPPSQQPCKAGVITSASHGRADIMHAQLLSAAALTGYCVSQSGTLHPAAFMEAKRV